MQINSKQLKTENVSIEDVYEALSDNKALVLFNTVALADDDDVNRAPLLIRKLGLTTRQYYSRITRLTETGLIRRQNGRYSLTLLGKMIYDIHITTSKVLSYHWKLKAIESIQMSNPVGVIQEEEFSKLVDTLMDDFKIKNMVAKAIYPQLTNSEKYPRQQQEEEAQSIENTSKDDSTPPWGGVINRMWQHINDIIMVPCEYKLPRTYAYVILLTKITKFYFPSCNLFTYLVFSKLLNN